MTAAPMTATAIAAAMSARGDKRRRRAAGGATPTAEIPED